MLRWKQRPLRQNKLKLSQRTSNYWTVIGVAVKSGFPSAAANTRCDPHLNIGWDELRPVFLSEQFSVPWSASARCPASEPATVVSTLRRVPCALLVKAWGPRRPSIVESPYDPDIAALTCSAAGCGFVSNSLDCGIVAAERLILCLSDGGLFHKTRSKDSHRSEKACPEGAIACRQLNFVLKFSHGSHGQYSR